VAPIHTPGSSLDNGTKLVRPGRMGRWLFVLYPEAAEGGGSFRSAIGPKGSGAFVEPPADTRPDAIRRARGKVRRYCAANRLNRLGTLTYAGTGNHDPERLREDVGRFFRRLRGGGERFPYLWVPEWHPGGHGLHVHFVVGKFVHFRTIRRAWGHGHVDIRLLTDLPVGSGTLGEARLAARYLAKYIGKDLGAGEAAGLHRYEVGQGFQPKRHGIAAETLDEALGWASIAMSAGPARVWRSRDEADWAGPPAVWASWL